VQGVLKGTGLPLNADFDQVDSRRRRPKLDAIREREGQDLPPQRWRASEGFGLPDRADRPATPRGKDVSNDGHSPQSLIIGRIATENLGLTGI